MLFIPEIPSSKTEEGDNSLFRVKSVLRSYKKLGSDNMNSIHHPFKTVILKENQWLFHYKKQFFHI